MQQFWFHKDLSFTGENIMWTFLITFEGEVGDYWCVCVCVGGGGGGGEAII